MEKRYLILNTLVRRYTIETNATEHLTFIKNQTEAGIHKFKKNEEREHSARKCIAYSKAIRRAFPDAKLTWSVSYQALSCQNRKYRAIRQALKSIHEEYGDDIAYCPGGYSANVYAPREVVNNEMDEAHEMICAFMGGYKPRSLLAGFLASENIAHAREKWGIKAVQGHAFSQHGIDAWDTDGGVCYPFYPSKTHFLKPAQGKDDIIDCLNLDGWSIDFVSARHNGITGVPKHLQSGTFKLINSRLGVGPIETLHRYGVDIGLKEMQSTVNTHFSEEALKHNPFGYITDNYEIVEARRVGGYAKWLAWIKATYPDTKCLTMADFAEVYMKEYADNSRLSNMFYQKGSGIDSSFANQEVVWIMNKAFRMGLLKQKDVEDSGLFLYDLTEYTGNDREPQEVGVRNWSMMNILNQKQTRPQDKPQRIDDLGKWLSENTRLNEREKGFITEKLR